MNAAFPLINHIRTELLIGLLDPGGERGDSATPPYHQKQKYYNNDKWRARSAFPLKQMKTFRQLSLTNQKNVLKNKRVKI